MTIKLGHIAAIMAILADAEPIGEEIKRPKEPDFSDFKIEPAVKYTSKNTHPRSPARHKPKRKK